MPSRRVVRTLLVAPVLVLGLVLGTSGCGGGDAKTAVTTPTSSPTADPSAEAAQAKAFCDGVDLAAVGRVAGGTVFKTDDPNGGCSFAQDDQAAATIGFTLVVDGVANGGLDSARRATANVVTGTLSEVPAAGDGAFVVVGSIQTNEDQAQGAVVNGDDIVLVTVIQRKGLAAKRVLRIASGALEIAARTGPSGSGT